MGLHRPRAGDGLTSATPGRILQHSVIDQAYQRLDRHAGTNNAGRKVDRRAIVGAGLGVRAWRPRPELEWVFWVQCLMSWALLQTLVASVSSRAAPEPRWPVSSFRDHRIEFAMVQASSRLHDFSAESDHDAVLRLPRSAVHVPTQRQAQSDGPRPQPRR